MRDQYDDHPSGLTPRDLAEGRLVDPRPKASTVVIGGRGVPDDWPRSSSDPAVDAEVRARSQGVCEVCRRRQACHKHHRKLRRHGDHRPVNLAHVCDRCHDVIHSSRYARWAWDHNWLVSGMHDPADKLPLDGWPPQDAR